MDIRDSTQSLSKKDIIGGSSSLKEKTMNGRVSTQSLAKEDIIGEKRSYKNGWCSCLLGGLPYYKENTMDERDSTQSLSEEDTVGDKKGSLQFIQPVEKLREAGIKFKKREEEEGIDSFLDIKFRDGILEIPCLTTSEIMSPLILNCIAFEQSFKDSTKHFTSYFNFISYLINTPLDAAYLRKKKIIENFFGTDQELVNFFNEVGKNIPYYFQEDYLMEVCNQVEIYYRNIWHVRCAEFWYKYCGSLWIVMSALAAVFLILLSMLQGGLALYKVIKGSP
ncbi:uncharacterized protein [Euphorbia lathyris]|uniref:uncharacterized protein n=1 Tax=Euphorbia lathyris TaxID=212925 RepID=UPI003313E76E